MDTPCEEIIIKELAQKWNDSGVQPGDIVLVHSSLSIIVRRYRNKGVQLDAGDVIRSFQKAVGSKGTLLFPLFNFAFAEGEPFNINTTPSMMGALTESARCHPEAVRTGHPIYSFAIIGFLKNAFNDVDNFSGYGADSPFAILRKLDGKIAVLDLPDQNSMTFYHHVEEMEQVPYRYHKIFKGFYTDGNGNQTEKSYGLFVRDLERGVLTHVNPMGELLWEEGLYSGCRPGKGCGLRVVSANSLYAATESVIRYGKALGMLYKIGTKS